MVAALQMESHQHLMPLVSTFAPCLQQGVALLNHGDEHISLALLAALTQSQ